jgi:chemotaxis protein MotB
MKPGLEDALKAGFTLMLLVAAAAAWWAYSTRGELAQKEAEVAAAQARAAKAANEGAERLKAREAELRGSLQQEIAGRDVEINRLKDQLSVRVLDRILFRSGSAAILPAGETVLAKLAPALAKGDEHIRVEGHTDNMPIGDTLRARYASNWELSTARAASVVRYFQQHGKIDPKRLEAVGFGEYRPVVSNDKPGARQGNRRVEIVLTAKVAAKPAAQKPRP